MWFPVYNFLSMSQNHILKGLFKMFLNSWSHTCESEVLSFLKVQASTNKEKTVFNHQMSVQEICSRNVPVWNWIMSDPVRALNLLEDCQHEHNPSMNEASGKIHSYMRLWNMNSVPAQVRCLVFLRWYSNNKPSKKNSRYFRSPSKNSEKGEGVDSGQCGSCQQCCFTSLSLSLCLWCS